MGNSVVLERAGEKANQCRHHWIIDVAGGPTSRGVCRYCGAQRQFKNYIEGADWDSSEPVVRDPVATMAPSLAVSDDPEEGF